MSMKNGKSHPMLTVANSNPQHTLTRQYLAASFVKHASFKLHFCIFGRYVLHLLKFIFIYLFAQLASFKLGNAFLGSGYIYRALFLFLQQTTKPHLI